MTAFIGISIISILAMWTILTNGFGLFLVLSPFLFVLYRLIKGDNSARWFTSVLLLFWGSVIGYQAWTYQTQAQTNIALHGTPAIEAYEQTMDSYIPIAAFFGVLLLAVGLLHTQSSRSWYTGESDDA